MRQACVNACASIDDKNSRVANRESQQDQMFGNLENLTAGMTFLVSQKPEVLESFEILRTVKEYLSTQAADAQLVQPFDSLAQETLQLQVDKLTANNEKLQREADHDKTTISKLVQLLPQGESALISTTENATGEVVEANSFEPQPPNINNVTVWNEQVQVQAAIHGSSSECSTLLTRKNVLDTERWANTRNNFMPVKHAHFNDYVKGTPDPAHENTRITTDRAQIEMHQGCHTVNSQVRCTGTKTPVDVIWYFHQLQ
jgi:hypothetical protein